MEEKWSQIKAWLQAHAPHLVEALNPGATDADFETLESITRARLPESFKAFYRIHNGQNPHTEGVWAGEELLSTERIAEEWQVWKQLLDNGDFEGTEVTPDEGIRKTWWSPAWLPLTYDGSGNHDCIDLDPAEGGQIGQVVRMWHDDAERYLVALSFDEWVDYYIDDLQDGSLVYDEDYGIMESEDAPWNDEG